RAHIVEELVKTAHSLSGRRIGALIVFERAGGLRYYVELGVPLDALVSADLLETVFLPQSPLHDGAVIIQGDRARAAGCFLPLSVAAGLWLFVAVGERSQLALAAPVEYVGLPDDAVLLPDPRDRVELQVEVGRWAVSRLTSEALRVRVNVAHLPEGESQLTLAPSDVQTPPGVRVTRITPP